MYGTGNSLYTTSMKGAVAQSQIQGNSVEFMALREISQHLEAKIETVQS